MNSCMPHLAPFVVVMCDSIKWKHPIDGMAARNRTYRDTYQDLHTSTSSALSLQQIDAAAPPSKLPSPSQHGCPHVPLRWQCFFSSHRASSASHGFYSISSVSICSISTFIKPGMSGCILNAHLMSATPASSAKRILMFVPHRFPLYMRHQDHFLPSYVRPCRSLLAVLMNIRGDSNIRSTTVIGFALHSSELVLSSSPLDDTFPARTSDQRVLCHCHLTLPGTDTLSSHRSG